MRMGVIILPEHPWPDAGDIWRHVEDLGFPHAWTYDHLSWRTLRDGPWYDSMTTLSAAAAVTRRIRLGTLVMSPDFRHPVTAAKQVMTLDAVSGGRFLLGLGAGAGGPDATATGGTDIARTVRTARFEEFVELTDALLSSPVTTWRGRHFAACDARMVPGCVQRPRVPFVIAAAGPRGMRLAARYGQAWATIGLPTPGEHDERAQFDALRAQVATLERACLDVGRDPAELQRVVHLSRIAATPYASRERFADLVGRCADLGFTDAIVGYPRSEGVFAGNRTAFEKVLSEHLCTT